MRFDCFVEDVGEHWEERGVLGQGDFDRVQIPRKRSARSFSAASRSAELKKIAQRLEEQGYECWFAYEEAIGFMNGLGIRDKDGVRPLLPHIAPHSRPHTGICRSDLLRNGYATQFAWKDGRGSS